jgi:hypothetical protein
MIKKKLIYSLFVTIIVIIIMDLTIILICEYIYIEDECISYLNAINIRAKQYDYVYKSYNINHVRYKKRTRKLTNVSRLNLYKYPNLMYLEYDPDTNQKIGVLLNTIIHIYLGDKFNQELFTLPNHLQRLEFGHDFNQKLPQLPNSLIYLSFGEKFNQSIILLPSRLIHLEIGYYFNQYLCRLPDKLQTLKWNAMIDYPIIPSSLITLTLRNYNHEIKSIPSHITCLGLGWKYNYKLPTLPFGLRKLYLGSRFNKEIKLPSLLTHLYVGEAFRQVIKIPYSLTHLDWQCDHRLPHLHDTITHLKLGYWFKYEIQILPPRLKYLWYYCVSRLSQLPKELIYLRVERYYSHTIDHLPDSLIKLEWRCNIKLPKLPSKLAHLSLTHCFKQNVHELPSSLTHLEIAWYFKRTICALPDNLLHLKWFCNLMMPVIPKTINEIMIYDDYEYINRAKRIYGDILHIISGRYKIILI